MRQSHVKSGALVSCHCSHLGQTGPVTPTPPATTTGTARERARAEIMREILDTGRAHLARDGAASLSLRAVARDLGMVSSAVYRYVPNRDALLTMLIIDAYDGMGAAVEKAEHAVARADYLGRFLAACHGVRTWALAHPQEYALVYGSPVPGYAAPQDTIGPASRVPVVLLTILADLQATGRAPKSRPVEPEVSAAIDDIRAFSGRADRGRPPPARDGRVERAVRRRLLRALRAPAQRRGRRGTRTQGVLRPPDATGGRGASGSAGGRRR